MFFCNGKIILFTEINNSKRGYPTFWTAPLGIKKKVRILTHLHQVDLSEYKAERIDIEILNATKFYFDNFFLEDEGIFEVEPILICDNYYLDKDDAKNKIILNKIATKAAHNQSDDQYFKDIDEHLAMFQSIFDLSLIHI